MNKEEKKVGSGKKKIITPGIVALAFVAAIAVFAVMLYTEKKVVAAENTVSVVVSRELIENGRELGSDNIDELFYVAKVPESLVPLGAIVDASALDNKTSKIDIAKGSIVTDGMFSQTDVVKSLMKEPVMACFKADDLYQVVGGIIRKGDEVHIYTEMDDGSIKLRWSNVQVVDSFDSKGDPVNTYEEGRTTRFNIYIEKSDVEEFYRMMDSKRVRIVKKCE